MKSLSELQQEIGSWAKIEFGENVSRDPNSVSYGAPLGSLMPLLGMYEELGELVRVILKAHQGRSKLTPTGQRAAKEDAVSDLMVFLCDYCSREGINLQVKCEEVWSEVCKRRRATWEADKAGETQTVTQDGHGFGHVSVKDEDGKEVIN